MDALTWKMNYVRERNRKARLENMRLAQKEADARNAKRELDKQAASD